MKNNFKKIVVSSILATDMARHFKLLEKFKKRVLYTVEKQENENEITNGLKFNSSNFEDQKV